MDINKSAEWARKNSNVYILGAGFSHNFGLPLTSNFILELVKCCENENFISHINSACRNFFPSFRDAFENYPDVEDLYSYYYSLTNYYSLLGSESNRFMLSFFPEFLYEVAIFLDRKVKNVPKDREPYIKEFCEGLKSSDVIISFNWDNLLEYYLEKYNIPFTFQLSEKVNKVVLLKLHGSIDWFKTKENLSDRDSFQPIVNNDVEYVFRNKRGNFVNFMKKDKILPFFVPPLSNKDELLIPLGEVWRQAYLALRNRLNKVYIGYSLPKADTMARVLFSSYKFMADLDEDDFLEKEKIRVIDPNENALLNFKKYCSDNFEFWCSTYKTCVDSVTTCYEPRKRLNAYKDILLNCQDKFVQSVAMRIFDESVYPIDVLEKARVKEYLKEFHNIDVEL